MKRLAAWGAAPVLWLWRLTCRTRIEHDPRPPLRAAGRPYVLALRHAHQLAAMLANDEPALAAMLSRSRDADWLAPSLRLLRVEPVRGSTRSAEADKGGREALAELASRLTAGTPVVLTCDGPRGPRGRVHRGVADLALGSGAVLLPVLALAQRRWIVSRSWDRFQVPLPFSRLHAIFGAPIEPAPGESARGLAARVAAALDQLERRHDPQEAPPDRPGELGTD